MSKIEINRIIDPAIELVKEVGHFIRTESLQFDRSMIEFKGLNDLVSYVDKEAEKRLIKGLRKLIPESGFIAEEGTEAISEEEYMWIVDPLDGTTNFTHGIPVYSVSVALQYKSDLVLGIVYEVNKDECFWSAGDGAYCNSSRIYVSSQDDLSGSIVATGFPYHNFENLDSYMDILIDLMQHSHGIRRFGSAAVDLAYVACGRFEAFFEYNLHPWDVAAGAFLVTSAGGTVTDFSGGKDFVFGRHIVAANGTHPALLQLVKKNW